MPTEREIELEDVVTAIEDVERYVNTLPASHPARVEWGRARAWIRTAVDSDLREVL